MPQSSSWSKAAAALSAAALFVALGGPAEAKHLITGKDIKDGSIGRADLSKAARKALAGKRGPAGPRGLPGAPSTAGRVAHDAPHTAATIQGQSVAAIATATIAVPAGSHYVAASGVVSVVGPALGASASAYVAEAEPDGTCPVSPVGGDVTGAAARAGTTFALAPQWVFPAAPGTHTYVLCLAATTSSSVGADEPQLTVVTAAANGTGGTTGNP